MPWILHLPERDIDVAAEVPLRVWAEIERETGIQWVESASRPLANAWVACLLADKAAAHFGVEAPTLPKLPALVSVVGSG